MKIDLALAALACSTSGCAAGIAGGARGTGKVPGGATAEGVARAGAGVGDRDMAGYIVTEGAFGLSTSGEPELQVLLGDEIHWYEDDDTGGHFGLFGGARVREETEISDWTIQLGYGYAWVLGTSQSEDSGGGRDWHHITALSLDFRAGGEFPAAELQGDAGLVVGVGLTVRYDSYQEWTMSFR